MVLEEVVKRLKEHPIYMSNGCGLLSRRFKCPKEVVKEAKNIIRGISTPTHKVPKILIFDVETAPMRAYVWGRWKQNISLDATISEWYMLCWSAKWLYSDYTMSNKLTSEEAVNEDDSRIIKSLWNLIDEADIVVAHNAKKADIKWMNTRFILNGLNPPKPYHIIDTLEVAKKEFGFSSNKLDALAGYFNIPHKLGTDFELWVKCVNGDEEALNYMCEYNKVDVQILEEVYLYLRPWIKNHPNCGNLLSSATPICSSCSSKKLELLEGKYYYTSVGKYQLYRCKDCGAISRDRINLNKNNKLISIAR